jgi:hypothetical protein
VNQKDLRTLLGGMTREHLERMLGMLAATAPDHFEIALKVLHEPDPDPPIG